jgi:FlaA1/EpsC-like NDP-sugar epimerase
MLRPIVILVLKGYDSTWRFFCLRDQSRLALHALPLTIVLVGVRYAFFPPFTVPYSVIALEYSAFLMAASGMRILRRVTYQGLIPATRSVNTLVVGNGSSLAGAIRHVELYNDVKLVGLVTDDSLLRGLRISGVPVLGSPESLPRLMASLGVDLVMIAGASFPGGGGIIEKVAQFGAQVRILPTVQDLVNGAVRVSRNVGVSEIAPRRSIHSAGVHPKVVNSLRNRTVLVTGAGGSIGSEIARQIVKLPISKLIIFDHDENSIFELNSQLQGINKTVISIVGDIRNQAAVRAAFMEHQPHVVLHAAAYKHVPVMESNCCEAVLNNVFGTRQLVEAAVEFRCERFVMISTDKAVRSASVMGATKRVAEMLVQQRAAEASCQGTSFACVRFGNVLGSRGSVVPIFLSQIAAGGPITITHEEMTRYFMTIPQAVQLVLQAATLASSGDIYELEMGDPVKIIDFANELVRLSGQRPGKDIEIKVVGIRPGEKLHEQLWFEDADVESTEFQHVLRVKAQTVSANFEFDLRQLEQLATDRSSNSVIQDFLQEMPIDYRQESQLELPPDPSSSSLLRT